MPKIKDEPVLSEFKGLPEIPSLLDIPSGIAGVANRGIYSPGRAKANTRRAREVERGLKYGAALGLAAPIAVAPALVAGTVGLVAGGVAGLLVSPITMTYQKVKGHTVTMPWTRMKDWGITGMTSAGKAALVPAKTLLEGIKPTDSEQANITDMTWEDGNGTGLRRDRVDLLESARTNWYSRARTYLNPQYIRPIKAFDEELDIAKAVLDKAIKWNADTPAIYGKLFGGYFTKNNPFASLNIPKLIGSVEIGAKSLSDIIADNTNPALQTAAATFQKEWQDYQKPLYQKQQQDLGSYLKAIENNMASLGPDSALRLLHDKQGECLKNLDILQKQEIEFLKNPKHEAALSKLAGKDLTNDDDRDTFIKGMVATKHKSEKDQLSKKFSEMQNTLAQDMQSHVLKARAFEARLLSLQDPKRRTAIRADKRAKAAKAAGLSDKVGAVIDHSVNPELNDFDYLNTEAGNRITPKKAAGKHTGEWEMDIPAHYSDFEVDADCGDLVATLACARPPHKNIELTCSTDRVARMLYRNARLHGFDESQIKLMNNSTGKPFDLDPAFKQSVDALVARKDAISQAKTPPEVIAKNCAHFKEKLHEKTLPALKKTKEVEANIGGISTPIIARTRS